MLDCDVAVTSGLVRADTVQRELPNGFSPAVLDPLLTEAWISFWHCAGMVFGNVSAFEGARMATFTVLVTPPGDLGRDSAYNQYLLRAWAPDDSLRGALAPILGPVQEASNIDMVRGGDVRLRIVDADRDAVRFESPLPRPREPSQRAELQRLFVAADTWLDLDIAIRAHSTLPFEEGTITGEDATLQRVLASPVETWPWRASERLADGVAARGGVRAA